MKSGLPKKTDWVWNARWASYWFDDEDLFEFAASDFDRKARELAAAGVNAVITFGGFHFRWSFTHDWPRLLRMLKRICSSCHRHGIKVVEHHSALWDWHPVREENWRAVFDGQRRKGVSMERHPESLRAMREGDMTYKGVNFSAMRQIDPRTGLFALGAYRALPFCPNNPDFQRLYFEHLKDIYACGVDGIMTDDVAFGKDHACGCIHCRAKFKRDTGYDIPPSGIDDKNFYGNLGNPAGRAWMLWRLACHREYQRRLIDHFRRLGRELARPIYCSSNTNSYAARSIGVSLENLDGCYHTVFTEVNSTEPQAHCWLRISAEASRCNALARRNGVPPMTLFYPHNADENLFCWAMTKTWGQNYWGTNWSMPQARENAMLARPFLFEQKHSGLYKKPESIAEIGVLFSARTVWLHEDKNAKPDSVRMSDPATTDCWAGWCEVLRLANISFDTIGENDLEEEKHFDRLRLLIVPNAVCLSGKAVRVIKAFVRGGGKLILTHQSGMKDETGVWRKRYPFRDLIGAETPISTGGKKRPAVFRRPYGEGETMYFADDPGRIVCVNRHRRIEKHDPNATGSGRRFSVIDFRMNPGVKRSMRAAVRSLLPEPPVEAIGFPEGFILGAYARDRRLVAHVTNAAGTLLDHGKRLRIPATLRFPSAGTLPGGRKTMLIRARRDFNFDKAVLRSPEFAGEQRLIVRKEAEGSVVEVPAGLVRCYCVIEAY